MTAVSLSDIQSTAAQLGLVTRGGFPIAPEDGVPGYGEGELSGTLLLFGNAGSSIWGEFSRSTEYADGNPDPLNRWSQRVGINMAEAFGGQAFFPFGGPPYQPFLGWAKKAESLQNSRLGMLIHPQYGLWHAYRFAIAFPGDINGLTSPPDATDICAKCKDQPCLSACPVSAFDGDNYDVEGCYGYLAENPDSKCLTQTCEARFACPEGGAFNYELDHARFHMSAFYRSIHARFSENLD